MDHAARKHLWQNSRTRVDSVIQRDIKDQKRKDRGQRTRTFVNGQRSHLQPGRQVQQVKPHAVILTARNVQNAQGYISEPLKIILGRFISRAIHHSTGEEKRAQRE